MILVGLLKPQGIRMRAYVYNPDSNYPSSLSQLRMITRNVHLTTPFVFVGLIQVLVIRSMLLKTQ